MPPEPRQKVRVLFVDDEVELLAALRLTLRSERRRWSTRFASGGAEALALLAEEPADVVVSDMRMPGMDGAELQRAVRDAHPGTIRLILSGQSDEFAALRAVPVVHQWLSKPCSREHLVRTVDRAVATRRLLGCRRVVDVVGGLGTLPMPPRTYQALTALLLDEEVSVERVSALVGRDAALAARVLQMVNSAFFGLPRHLVDIGEAVGMLGFETLSRLVLTAEVVEAFRPERELAGYSFDHFHEHALLVARVAARVLDDERRAGEASTAGLLHDLGQLVLAHHLPAEFEKVWARVAAGEADLETAERDLAGASHGEIGGALLGLWGLPDPVVQAVAFHHAPWRMEVDELDPLVAVHVAQALAHAAWSEVEPETKLFAEQGGEGELGLDHALLARLGLAERLEEWRALAATEAAAIHARRGEEAA